MEGCVAAKQESRVPREERNTTRVEDPLEVAGSSTTSSRAGVVRSSTSSSNGCWRFTAAPPPTPATFPWLVEARSRPGIWLERGEQRLTIVGSYRQGSTKLLSLLAF